MEIAELAVRYRDDGVVGFDIAGAEAGNPPTRHLDAFEYLQRENAHFTIHAGEAFGLPSIWQAIQWCGADRLGHGVRIIDDIAVGPDGTATLGPARGVRAGQADPAGDGPTSNVRPVRPSPSPSTRSGCCAGCGFRVTVNTDNRLMSGTSMTREMVQLAEAFGYGCDDFRWFTVNAMKSAFIPFDERLALIEDVIKPGYAALDRLTTHPVGAPRVDHGSVINSGQPRRASRGRAAESAVRAQAATGWRVPTTGRCRGGARVEQVDGRAAGAAVDQVDALLGADEGLDGARAAQLAQAALEAVGEEHVPIRRQPSTIRTIHVPGRNHQED